MNNSFYKILKFEFKQNILNWAILVSIFVLLVIWYMFQNYIDGSSTSFDFRGSAVPLTIIFLGLITLHSYTESTNRQSMEMYHLLPVSRNRKFFTKQFITALVFPLLLLIIYLIIATIANLFVLEKYSGVLFSPNIKPHLVAILFITGHALSTIFAIVFKKNKLMYATVTFLALFIGITMLVTSYKSIFGVTPLVLKLMIMPNQLNDLSMGVPFIFPIVLYFISYRLFFRRQL